MRSSDSSRRRAADVVSGYILDGVVWVALIWALGAAHPQRSAETTPASESNRPVMQFNKAETGALGENAQAVSLQPNRQAVASLYQGQSCPPRTSAAQTSGRVALSFRQSMQLALKNNFDGKYQAEKSAVNVARFGEELTRQQIAAQTALAYINAISANRAIESSPCPV